jgi:glycosyltransferase involved in cell wall biosynthesis
LSQWLILSSVTLSSGTGIRLKGIANGLSCNGNGVYLVGAGDYHPAAPGVKHIQVKGSALTLVMALRLLVANLEAVIRIRPDYCIASKPLPHTVIPALLAKWLGAVTLLDFDDLESGYWQGRFWLPLLRFWETISPRLLHSTCVHTEELAQEVTDRAGLDSNRVLRLDQGVDVHLFSPWKNEDLPANRVILYAAHLGVAAEGLHFVLKGFKILVEKRNDTILLVVGAGPLLPRFHQEVQAMGLNGMVVFAGQLHHNLMPKVMRLARAAVNYNPPENQASRYRASVKVREYLAMGLPVATNIVGSDLSSFTPLLQVFEAGDMEGFAAAVERALAQGPKEDNDQELRENWAWEAVVGRFLYQLGEHRGLI